MYQDCWKATLGAVDCRRSEKRLHKGLILHNHYRTIVEALQTSLFIEMAFFDCHFSSHTLGWLSVTVWYRSILSHHVKHSYSRSHCYSFSRVMNAITMSIYCLHFLISLSTTLLACIYSITKCSQCNRHCPPMLRHLMKITSQITSVCVLQWSRMYDACDGFLALQQHLRRVYFGEVHSSYVDAYQLPCVTRADRWRRRMSGGYGPLLEHEDLVW